MAVDRGRVLPLFFTPALLRRLRLETPQWVDQLDKEFAQHRRQADYLLRLRCGDAAVLNHWEFQKFSDASMPGRMATYQAAGFEMYGLPMLSLVVYINGPGKAVKISKAQVGPLSRTGWVEFSLPALVRTWPAQIDSPLGVVFRCLVSDVRQGMLVRCFEELLGTGLDQPTCRTMVEMLAYLLDKRNGGDGGRYLDILKKDLNMLDAEGSLFYQYGVEKGIQKGIDQGIQKTVEKLRLRALNACRQRFSTDEAGLDLLSQRLHQVKDFDVLADFLAGLSTTPDTAAALSLLPLPASNGKNGHHND